MITKNWALKPVLISQEVEAGEQLRAMILAWGMHHWGHEFKQAQHLQPLFPRTC